MQSTHCCAVMVLVMSGDLCPWPFSPLTYVTGGQARVKGGRVIEVFCVVAARFKMF